MNTFSDRVAFLWSIADLIRDTFKRGKYQDVILPFTVLRRIDCVLQPTKQLVLARNAELRGKLDNLDPALRAASGFAFYNTSLFDFERLLEDAPNLAANLSNYIAGFSRNMAEVLEKFDFPNTIAKLDEAGLLFLVMERFRAVDLHPSVVSNADMGSIFEELIRKFNEALDENPGEHFTPREVIRLMVDLLLSQDEAALRAPHIIRTVYDPCCGTGGMLTAARDRIAELNARAQVHLFGQEVNPETFAVCKSDLYMKSADGRDADNIKFGSTLSHDQHAARRFDYQLANPPYGKDWKRDEQAVKDEHARGTAGRFAAGLPRISDGQLLFLVHMLGRMNEPTPGTESASTLPSPRGGGAGGEVLSSGGRVAIVMNGSPLFTGDAGSGESEIRRWILENDWLEAIIALPEQLFYNTGIATYIWVLSNVKRAERRGRVQLIDATDAWVPMRRSLGDKRREISAEQIGVIVRAFVAGGDRAANGGTATGQPATGGTAKDRAVETAAAGCATRPAYAGPWRDGADSEQTTLDAAVGASGGRPVTRADSEHATRDSHATRDASVGARLVSPVRTSPPAPSPTVGGDARSPLAAAASAENPPRAGEGRAGLIGVPLGWSARLMSPPRVGEGRVGSSLRSQIFATTAFGYRKITVERPLRLNFEVSDERLTRLEEQAAFAGLVASGKPTGKGNAKGKGKQRDEAQVAAALEAGRAQQEAIRAALRTLPATRYADRRTFERDLDAALRAASLRPSAPVVKAILAALGERDETAEICRDRQGNPEPDAELRDTENVPLGEDVFAYFEREVRPHVPDAWVNTEKRDARDDEVGIVGYEINFNRYFYQYTPPRPLDEIEADLRALEGEILAMLREVAR